MFLNLQLHTGCQRLWRPCAPASEVQDRAALPSQSALFSVLWRKLSVVHVFPTGVFFSVLCVFQAGRICREEDRKAGAICNLWKFSAFSVENHLEFPRQKEATTFCLLFLEFLFFSEQLIKDLRTTARKPFPLQSPQLCSQCAGCPLHRGQRHNTAARSREVRANGSHTREAESSDLFMVQKLRLNCESISSSSVFSASH